MNYRLATALVLAVLLVPSYECSAGEYKSAGTCYMCPRGFKCNNDAMTSCPFGTYSNYGSSSCTQCEAGFMCPTPKDRPVPCAFGTYAEAGSTTCISCPPGFTCPRSTAKTACSTGDYCLGGTNTNIHCPLGFMCVSPELLPVACPDGYYTNQTGRTSCTACAPGYFCAAKVDQGIQCPVGYYSPAAASKCTLCPAGSRCSAGSSSPISCPSDEYSLAGSETCAKCPAGYVCNSGILKLCGNNEYALDNACVPCSSEHQCINGIAYECPEGFYYNKPTTTCIICPAGSACPKGAISATACPVGSYAATGSPSCTVCPAGSYCPAATTPMAIPCPAGTYQDQRGQTSCVKCGAASCVTAGISTRPTACTPGQYFDGLYCKDCKAGYYCPYPDKPTMTACAEGFYSLVRETECKICPAGSECRGGTQTACGNGYYSAQGWARCRPCPVGYRCDTAFKTPVGIIKCPPGYTGSTAGHPSSTCDICPLDKMCPSSEVPPINCPPGTNAYRKGMTACVPCPHGYSCSAGTSTTPGSWTACAAGKYSYLYQTTCIDCPSFSACTGIRKADCPLHYFTPGKRASTCTPCTRGSTCLEGRDPSAITYTPTACKDSEYAVPTTYGCRKCPSGYSCAAGIATACPAGTYAEAEGNDRCDNCPFNMFSTAGASVCQVCPGGHRCDNTGAVIPCSPGQYSLPGQNTCSKGNAGFIYQQYADSPNTAAFLVPKGMYSVLTTNQCGASKCAGGTYSTTMGAIDGSACIDCPQGFYCLEGTGSPLLYVCPQGYFCKAKTKIPEKCPVNTYSLVRGGTAETVCRPCPLGFDCAGATELPKPCPAGYYCAGEGKKTCPPGYYTGSRTGLKTMDECLLCPAGFYCPQGTENAIPVPEGYYNPFMGVADNSSLQDCPPSYSCGKVGYATYEKVECKLGYYCPSGTVNPDDFPCPAGTFSNSYEAIAESDCILCPRGYACPEGSTIAIFLTLPCDEGHYCPRGTPAEKAASSNPSVPAYTRPNYKCPAGTYRSVIGARRIEDCLPCPHGQYCGEGTVTPSDCVEGHYCPLGTEYDKQYPCKAGTYSNSKGLKSQEGCLNCGLGYYCEKGATAIKQCEIGFYNDFSEQAAKCVPCPAGSHCSNPGTTTPTPCLAGTYSEEEKSACSPCEPGYFCPEKGISKAVMLSSFKCYAGMLCAASVSEYPTLASQGCPAGSYCPEATLNPIPCPKGTYNPYTGRGSIDDCLITPAGHYTNTDGSIIYQPCDTGHFCLAGSADPKQHKCPAGTFRNMTGGTGPEDCGTCHAGYQCPTEGVTQPKDCDPGYYCPTGTIIPEACPEGTFSINVHLYDSQGCTSCPAGLYCPQRGMTGTTKPCDAGFYCMGGSKRPEPLDKIMGDLCPMTGYCPEGISAPQACGAGTYVVIKGAYEIGQCISCLPGHYCDGTVSEQPKGECDPGYFCVAGSITRTNEIAPTGTYAPLGSRRSLKCPFGKYNGLPGKATCDDCDSGSLCAGIGLTAKSPCPKGYYCPSYSWFGKNSMTYDKQSCPSGTYNNQENRASITDCLPCSGGKFCPTRAIGDMATDKSQDCAPQYYCTSGSPYKAPPYTVRDGLPYGICPMGKYCPAATDIPKDCSIGTYSKSEMLDNIADCVPCYEGKYCEKAGEADPTGDCSLGYYCPPGSSSLAPTNGLCKQPLYCPLGSVFPINCPTGFYQNLDAQGTCIQCPKGMYCNAGTQFSCDVGFYCP